MVDLIYFHVDGELYCGRRDAQTTLCSLRRGQYGGGGGGGGGASQRVLKPRFYLR